MSQNFKTQPSKFTTGRFRINLESFGRNLNHVLDPPAKFVHTNKSRISKLFENVLNFCKALARNIKDFQRFSKVSKGFVLILGNFGMALGSI